MFQLRQFLKILCCRIVFYSGLLDIYVKKVLLKRGRFGCVIINYHSFVYNFDQAMELEPCVTHHIDAFKKEMKFLKKYFDVISLDKLVDHLKTHKDFARPTIAITIDDGYKDNFDLLWPVIKLNQIPVTIFLTAGCIGTRQKMWVNKLAEMFLLTKRRVLNLNGLLPNGQLFLNNLREKRRAYAVVLGRLKNMDIVKRDEYMKQIEHLLGTSGSEKPVMLDWTQARIMLKDRVTFGAHTCTHPILTNMPLQDAKKEIADSKTMIEKNLGITVRHFAFPNGRPQDFNEDMRAYCKELGFESISSCDYGSNGTAGDVFSLKRIGADAPLPLFAVNVIRTFCYYKLTS